MPKNPPEDVPRINAHLAYLDARAAADWRRANCGFVERAHARVTDEDGTVRHTALQYADGVVLVGNPGPDCRGPIHHDQQLHQLYVYVDDVEAHTEKARAGGAKIVSDLEDTFYGDRRYILEGSGGFHWTFGQRVRGAQPAGANT